MPRFLRLQEVLKAPEPSGGQGKPDESGEQGSCWEDQLRKWEGNGVKVSIRSNEKCRECGVNYSEKNMFYCSAHDRHAEKVFINIAAKNIKGGRMRIYTDAEGSPLQKHFCFHMKKQIIDEIKHGVFNYKKYLPKDRGRLRFKNYKRLYLDRMNRRSELPSDDHNRISKHHLRDIKSAFKNHLHYFDDMDINEIKTIIALDWLDGLKLGSEMKRHLIGYLGGLLRYAHEREDIPVMPNLPSIGRASKKKKGINRQQQLEILSHIPKEHHPIFEWAKKTGRRINEYRAMKFRDIDEENNIYRLGGAFDLETYKLYPKVRDHAGEEFPLSVMDDDGIIVYDLRPIILEARKDRIPHPDAFVFEYMNQYGEKSHYPDKAVRRIFNKARKDAGFPDITLNAFARHSLGYQLRLEGATYADIANVLGNTAQVAESSYTHVEVSRKGKVLIMRELKSGHEVAMNEK